MAIGTIDPTDIVSINFDYDEENDNFIMVLLTKKEFLKSFGNRLDKKIEKETKGPLIFNTLKFSSSSVLMFD
jgi:hypothetical protein